MNASPAARAYAGDVVVPAARIRTDGDQPYSLDYQDIYHAPDGAAEVARVFVEPTALDSLARLRAATSGPANVVRVGELGFGSGFNFVVAAEHCLAAGTRLHFVSFESRPLDATDFRAVARRRAGSHPLYAALADAYPPRLGGWHRRWLADGRICLSLWWGDAQSGLADLAGRQRQPLDAWFLDGFAPDRNADLWTPDLFAQLAALSAPDTRVATFTAAGRVRRALESAGFAMRRVDQRPHKRESLAGVFQARGLCGFAPPDSVVVAGGGLAGASAAWHLARSGVNVRLYQPDDTPEGRDNLPASLLPATVLHARLLGDATPGAGVRSHGYLYAAALCSRLPGFQASGVLQLPGGTQDEARLTAIAARYAPSGPWLQWLNGQDAGHLAGRHLPGGGLHFPWGGVVDTPTLTAALRHQPGIEVIPEPLTDLPHRLPVVLACGAATRSFDVARHLEVAPVHGQLDFVELDTPPALPLVGSGYLVPWQGQVAAGATYEYRAWNPQAATRANLAQLEGLPYRWRFRRRGTRAVSSDRIAVAGLLHQQDGLPLDGRYVSSGHGSAGNVSAHLAGAVLSALIGGDCPPLTRDLEAALAPYRFRARQARRGYRQGASD